ncbi:nuclease [Desulfonema ishimotonii]|uniref:Nuclease n=1 Tax=Desulfonema ishimotonii TaxID=45657 RepID=A0A401FQA3_9BACT|nr:thermonuclease family protein [Desulfonema ishimotonii]GBC59169.1 nuclease [Desulfonema ishimotonii]
MEDKRFFYRAVVRSVYDGDTCTVDIDLGLGVWLHGEKLRLSRINAPELRGDERDAGLTSRDFLRKVILNREIRIQTVRDKKGKYGRFLADIWLFDEAQDKWLNVNDLLVEKGYAVYKDY